MLDFLKEIDFKKHLRFAGHILSLASLIYLADIFFDNLGKINNFRWDLELFLVITLGVMFVLVGYIAQGYAWHLQLKKKYPDFRFLESFKVIGTTQIAKYLPGNVGHFLGRGFLVAGKIENKDIVYSIFLENILIITASLVLGLFYFFYIDIRNVPLISGLSTFSVITLTIIFGSVSGLVVLKVAIKRLDLLELDLETILNIFFIFLLTLASGGIIVYLLFNLTDGPKEITLLLCMSSLSLSFLVGFIIPGAPGGIGVREYAFVLLSSSYMEKSFALEVILAFRLIGITADLVSYGISKTLSTHR